MPPWDPWDTEKWSYNTDLPNTNMLHLGSLSQTAEWIDWLQLVRLLHGMMVRSLVVAMCLIVGVEDDIDQVTLHSVNNTAMQLSDVFLLDYNEDKDPILGRMMVSMKYDEDVLVDHNGSIKSVGARSSSCNQPSQCCLFSCSSNIKCFFTISFVSTTADGRTGGRADGRTGRRADGRTDTEHELIQAAPVPPG